MKQLYARFEHPNSSFQRASADLDPNLFYKVEQIFMGGYSTDIQLECRDTYNSVVFEFYLDVDGEKVPHNIFSDPDYNPYLRSSVDPYHLLNNH